MAEVAKRPNVQEQVGRALNSSRLEHREDRDNAIVMVGALGAAALHVLHGVDRGYNTLSNAVATIGHRPDPQDVLASELASCLWHIRFAGQFEMVPRAVTLFAQWMAHRGRFRDVADAASLLPRLAARAMHESLSERCIACGGSGKLERSRTGSWIRPRGSMQRNAVFRTCSACEGSRRQAISHTERRVALAITRERYDQERWDAHFKAAHAWLVHRVGRLTRPLTVQLERSKKRV